MFRQLRENEVKLLLDLERKGRVKLPELFPEGVKVEYLRLDGNKVNEFTLAIVDYRGQRKFGTTKRSSYDPEDLPRAKNIALVRAMRYPVWRDTIQP